MFCRWTTFSISRRLARREKPARIGYANNSIEYLKDLGIGGRVQRTTIRKNWSMFQVQGFKVSDSNGGLELGALNFERLLGPLLSEPIPCSRQNNYRAQCIA